MQPIQVKSPAVDKKEIQLCILKNGDNVMAIKKKKQAKVIGRIIE
jgi:hypothetical protein